MIAPRKSRAANRGLTLVELLVVLVIVAVVAGFAVLATASLGGDPPQERTARRLAALVQLASENAVMEGRQYGLEIKPHHYRFLLYDGTNWQPINGDPTFRPRQIEDNVTLRLQLQGRPVTLPQPSTAMTAETGTGVAIGDNRQNDDVVDGPRPEIIALSSGELTPFNLAVVGKSADDTYHVRGHLNGKVQLIPPDSRLLNQ